MAGEVGQVEVDVAHTGVLPVQDVQPAVVQEVGVQQVVVAQAGLRPRPRRDLVELPVQTVEIIGEADTPIGCQAGVVIDHLERRERGPHRRQRVDRAQRLRHPGDHLRPAHFL